MKILYASELAASAMQLKPAGQPHKAGACVCAMCQRPIKDGDISSPKELPRSFMDLGHLARSDWLCGFCAATTRQDVMRSLQRSVICHDGIYNLNKDESRAWFWLTPPKPPYVVVINHNTTGAFHYFWRTPVTMDNNLVQMNVDGAIYHVRRPLFLQALEASRRVLDAYNVHAGRKKELKSPFTVLLRQPTGKAGSGHGRLNRELAAFIGQQPILQADARLLDTLGPGELIALSPILKSKPLPPIQPEFTRS